MRESIRDRIGIPSLVRRRDQRGYAALLVLTVLLVVLHLVPEACPDSGDRVVLAAVGDVMLSRGVARKIREQGFAYPFSGVSETVRSADIGFCNLECVLTDLPRPKSRGFVFRADPRNAEFLERAGFDLISIANNHVLDCGIDGYREMVAALQSADLTPVSGEPVIQEANGLTLGALAYDLVETRRVDGILEAVAELDRLADIVIVSLHWGAEYTLSPADWQVRLARELVDYGADLVLGHHPHRVQGIACYGGAVIVYSMGNCIFDQRDPLGNESVVLLIELTEYGVHQVTILPVSITGFRPAIASGVSGERILSSLALHSERLGTKVITLREEDAVRARFYPFRDVIQADRNKNRDSGRRGS